MNKKIKLILFLLTISVLTIQHTSCCMPAYSSHAHNLPLEQTQQEIQPDSSENEPLLNGTVSEKLVQDKRLKDSKKIQFNISYHIHVPGNTEKIVFTTTVPDNYHRRQEIEQIRYSPQPSRIFREGQTKYAEFITSNPGQELSINISTKMIIYGYDLNIARRVNFNPEQDLDPGIYLEPEKYLEIDDPIIADNSIIAEKIDNPVDKINKIYGYVIDNIHYDDYNPDSIGAASALLEGKGDCTEFTDVFVALCRASGLPARSVEGYFIHASELYRGHNWPEVYLADYGWVPFDPALDNKGNINTGTTFHNLLNAYVYLSFKRNDPVLGNFHYYNLRTWGDKVEVVKNIDYHLLEQYTN